MLSTSNMRLTAFAEELTSIPSELEGSYNEEILEEEILTSGIEAPSEDVELQLGEAPTDSDENLIVLKLLKRVC